MSVSAVVILTVLWIVPLALAGSSFHPKAPRVCIEDGCMRGSWMRSFLGNRFQAFIGVPFAKPPVGSLRFANPVPNERWSESELDASGKIEKKPCVQQDILLSTRAVEGSEDCLYLNVYSPFMISERENKNGSSLMPTLIFIHGGAFMMGWNSPLVLGAEKVMDHSVILVAISYRLGAFGFLSTGDEAASGNFGLKDQRLAMQWVQKNIHAFGGDPQQVTIIGQSAGGASVHYHLMHLQNEGLFQRAISLSGNALASWNEPKANPEQTARKQAALVGIENTDVLTTSELIQALRSVDADRIANSYREFTIGSRYPSLLYGPVIEPSTAEGAFLTGHPKDLWSQEKYLSVPWLTGFVPNDGFVFSFLSFEETECTQDLLQDQKRSIVNLLTNSNRTDFPPDLTNRFFPNQTTMNECFTKTTIDILTQVYNEGLFLYPLMLTARQHMHHSRQQKAPMFLYKFNYKGEQSYSSVFVPHGTSSHEFGIVHCDDLIYIFRAPILLPDTRRNSPDARASKQFIELLANFARTGTVTNEVETEHSALTSSSQFPFAIELINSNRKDVPVEQKFINLGDNELYSFWERFYAG